MPGEKPNLDGNAGLRLRGRAHIARRAPGGGGARLRDIRGWERMQGAVPDDPGVAWGQAHCRLLGPPVREWGTEWLRCCLLPPGGFEAAYQLFSRGAHWPKAANDGPDARRLQTPRRQCPTPQLLTYPPSISAVGLARIA